MNPMFTYRIANRASALVLALVSSSSLQAGPFADWWNNNTQTAYSYPTVAIPYNTGFYNTGTYNTGYGANPYNAYSGYPNTSYSPVFPAGLPQTNVGVLPTGGYASQYYRAPTTYYRPVTALDPNTGTTVTSLQPCASYQYQAQRVPMLVPSWSNYAYGGYGASNLQNRWSPVSAPAIGSATGQSSMSIASGFGTYGTSPVVQIPMTGAVLNTTPTLTSPKPITSGYGGIYYGQPLSTSNSFGTVNSVVPAAAWTTPSVPTYSPPNLNGSSFSTPTGGYFGSVPQTFPQPAIVTPSLPITSGYAPSGPSTIVNGVTITPIGPPVNSPYPTSSTVNGSTNSWIPSQSTLPSYTAPSTTNFGPMPGSMGQPVMPPSISTNTNVESRSNSIFPPVMPSKPAPISNGSPSSNGSSFQDTESMVTPSLNPSAVKNLKPETNELETASRFQLRNVERTPQIAEAPTEKPMSPWSNPSHETPKESSSNDPSTDNLELKLNIDSLRPIPPPKNFDASPDWKPTLLKTHDQTASKNRDRNVEVATPNSKHPNSKQLHEVRYLHSGHSTDLNSDEIVLNDGNVVATLRPMQKTSIPLQNETATRR